MRLIYQLYNSECNVTRYFDRMFATNQYEKKNDGHCQLVNKSLILPITSNRSFLQMKSYESLESLESLVLNTIHLCNICGLVRYCPISCTIVFLF